MTTAGPGTAAATVTAATVTGAVTAAEITIAPGSATAGPATHEQPRRTARGGWRAHRHPDRPPRRAAGDHRIAARGQVSRLRHLGRGRLQGRGPAHFGATHYLEHLLFKGTRRRTALDISAAMDAVGGELNAFTGKEYTCYYARVLDADLPLAIDVLSDMVTSSLIEPKDVDAERGVILEEIAMNDDDPTDTVHEAFAAQLFGDTPLGRPILGGVDSINAITREQIAEHYAARYTPDNVVIAAAGSLDHAQVVELAGRAFAAAAAGDAGPLPPRLAAEAGMGQGRHGGAAGNHGASSRRTWCSAARDCRGRTTVGSRSGC